MSLEHSPARSDDGPVLLIKLWPEAGKRLGLSRYMTYMAARLGQIPTVKMGRLLYVPGPALERMLQTAKQPRR